MPSSNCALYHHHHRHHHYYRQTIEPLIIINRRRRPNLFIHYRTHHHEPTHRRWSHLPQLHHTMVRHQEKVIYHICCNIIHSIYSNIYLLYTSHIYLVCIQNPRQHRERVKHATLYLITCGARASFAATH